MAVAFVSSNGASSSAASVTVPVVPGVVIGNLLVAFVYCSSNTAATFTAPAGWTLASQHPVGSWGSTAVWTKVATATEVSSTLAFAGSTRTAAVVHQYSGATGLDGAPVSSSYSGSSIASPTVPNVDADGMLVLSFGSWNATTFTTPAGTALRQSRRTVSASSNYTFDAPITAAGTSPSYITTTPASDTGIRVAVALAPTAGGPVTVTGIGALTAGSPTLSGSGTVTVPTVTGAGALTAAAPALAGSGALRIAGAGALIAPVSALSGSGTLQVTGAGELVAAVPEFDGAGQVSLIGSGVLVAAAPSLSGAGTITVPTPTVTGAGALVAGAPELSGAGMISIAGAGALVAGVPAVSGAGLVGLSGTGELVAEPGVLAGTGRVLDLSHIAETPRERTLVLAAEDRTWTVDRDPRMLAVAADTRTCAHT